MLSNCYVKYQKLKSNYDVAVFVMSSARDTETNDNLLTTGQNGLNIMGKFFHSFKSKFIHVLLVVGFGCPILYVTVSILLGSKCHQI